MYMCRSIGLTHTEGRKRKKNDNAHKCIRRRILEDNYGQYDNLRLMRGAAVLTHGGEEGGEGGDGRERESENINQFSSKYKSEIVPYF